MDPTAAARAALDAFATPAQLARWQPVFDEGARIVMATSEPDTGSDVSAISTKAVRDGDDFILDGQKKYIAGAGDADYLWVVVRTGGEGPRHRQFTSLLVPRNTPGIEVQPIIDMAGRRSADKVFFTGVRVPVANVVGVEGEAWAQLAFGAARTNALARWSNVLESQERRLIEHGQESTSTPRRDAVADAVVRVAVARLLANCDGGGAGHLPAAALAFVTKTSQELAGLSLARAGMAGAVLNTSDAPALEYLAAAYATISDGTAEVLRNEVAEELGLPS